MNSMSRDFRYAVRQLLKAPGFAATAVLTLAFGIGAITAIFSIVEGGLLRLLRALLFHVDPLDPIVLVLAAVSVFALALLAPVIPARRAAAVEPMQALRME